MKEFFRRATIKHKIMLVALVTTGTAVSLVSLVLIGTEVLRYHGDILKSKKKTYDLRGMRIAICPSVA